MKSFIHRRRGAIKGHRAELCFRWTGNPTEPRQVEREEVARRRMEAGKEMRGCEGMG